MALKYRPVAPPTVCNGVCIQEEPKRWKTCVSMANSGSGFELGRLFVDETFSGSSKQVSKPVQAQRDALLEYLSQLVRGESCAV